MNNENELKEQPIFLGWTKEEIEEDERLWAQANKEADEEMKRGVFPD